MAQISVREYNVTAVITILPSDKLLYRRFLQIFSDTSDPRSVDSDHWFAVHFALSNLMKHCTDRGQTECFIKFENSMRKWNQISFTLAPCKEYKNIPNEALARYRKLKNLIYANSVLFQHFGILDINVNEVVCDYVRVNQHKVCTSHIVKYQTAKEMRYFDSVTGEVYELDDRVPEITTTVLRKRGSGVIVGKDVVGLLKYYNNLVEIGV